MSRQILNLETQEDTNLLIGILTYWAELREQNGEFPEESNKCREWISQLQQ